MNLGTLLTTGITPVPDWVSREMIRPMIDGHGKEARALGEQICAGVGQLLETESEVFLLPATGSGGLEASLVNHLSPGDTVLACVNGFFSALYADIATKLGAHVEIVEVEWGRPIDWDQVRQRLAADRKGDIKALLITHHETSTGVLNNLADLRDAKGDHPALVLLNALSSFGGSPVLPDEWGVDVTVTCSHKGLMCPPGIAFIACNARARQFQARSIMRKAYFDLGFHRAWLSKGVMPFDPPLSVMFGIAKVLEVLCVPGAIEQTHQRTEMNASVFRSCIAGLPLDIVAVQGYRAPQVSVLKVTGGCSADELKSTLAERFGFCVSGGMGQLAHIAIRVNHQGWVFPREMISLGSSVRMVFFEHSENDVIATQAAQRTQDAALAGLWWI